MTARVLVAYHSRTGRSRGARLPRVALFATYDVMGVEAALHRMRALAGRAPLAQLAIARAELARGAAPRITRFAKELLDRLGAPAAVTV